MQNNPNTTQTQNPIMENEIRIKTSSRITNLIHYALKLLGAKNQESMTIKATGKAIPKAILVAERLKYDYAGLHQNTSIGDTIITNTTQSRTEGEEFNQSERIVSYIEITISKQAFDKTSPGYQKPNENTPSIQFPPNEGRGRYLGRKNTRASSTQANTTPKPANSTDEQTAAPRPKRSPRKRIPRSTNT